MGRLSGSASSVTVGRLSGANGLEMGPLRRLAALSGVLKQTYRTDEIEYVY